MMLKSTLTTPKVQSNVKRQVKPETPRPPTRSQIRRKHDSKVLPVAQLQQQESAEPKLTVKERFQAWKLIGMIIIIGIIGLTYLNHVFQTQAILKDVNALELDFEKARRIHADRKFTFERLTGPSEVYDRASRQGLVHGGAAEGVVIIKP